MRIGKERCERKAYPHRVYPDKNRIRLRVNGALVTIVQTSIMGQNKLVLIKYGQLE